MLTAIPRYGARVIPNTEQIDRGAARPRRARSRVRTSRNSSARSPSALGAQHADRASYGRMAFYYLLDALGLPPGSEIILPALTFWVIPELARVAGLTPVFADVDPAHVHARSGGVRAGDHAAHRAVVPTHLYGLPCDMDAIVGIARRHGLAVIEDCAHALGATWRGRPVGDVRRCRLLQLPAAEAAEHLRRRHGASRTMPASRARVARSASTHEPWPDEAHVLRRLLLGRVAADRHPAARVHAVAVPGALCGLVVPARTPTCTCGRRSGRSTRCRPGTASATRNVQAAIGLEGLTPSRRVDRAATSARARARSRRSAARRSRRPAVPTDGTHVYYQYARLRAASGTSVVKRASGAASTSRRCTSTCAPGCRSSASGRSAPGAERAATRFSFRCIRRCSMRDVGRVASVVRDAVAVGMTAGGAGTFACHLHGGSDRGGDRLRRRVRTCRLRRRSIRRSCSSRVHSGPQPAISSSSTRCAAMRSAGRARDPRPLVAARCHRRPRPPPPGRDDPRRPLRTRTPDRHRRRMRPRRRIRRSGSAFSIHSPHSCGRRWCWRWSRGPARRPSSTWEWKACGAPLSAAACC